MNDLITLRAITLHFKGVIRVVWYEYVARLLRVSSYGAVINIYLSQLNVMKDRCNFSGVIKKL